MSETEQVPTKISHNSNPKEIEVSEVSYICYIGLCGSKGYGFLDVLVWSFGNKTISLLMFMPSVYMP